MPFTPLHFGPGIAVKAATPRQFSLVVFTLVQIGLDVEVLWYLARGSYPLHRFWHTYLGATLLAAALALLGKPLSQAIKAVWNRIAIRCEEVELRVSVPTGWIASWGGAFVGAYSHIFLDSLFHTDLQPWWPWSATNRLSGSFSPYGLEATCVLLGIGGLIGLLARKRRREVVGWVKRSKPHHDD